LKIPRIPHTQTPSLLLVRKTLPSSPKKKKEGKYHEIPITKTIATIIVNFNKQPTT
jgi:hypothetical protein